VTSNVKQFLVLNFGLSSMADVFVQMRCDGVSGKLLMGDAYRLKHGTDCYIGENSVTGRQREVMLTPTRVAFNSNNRH
jgi:hypothetical protein